MSRNHKLSKKSKSLSSLQEGSFRDYHLHSVLASESDGVFVVRSDDDRHDSGLGEGDDLIGNLENKIDKLNDLYEEQCRLLADIKDEMRCSREDPQDGGSSLIMELLLRALQLNSQVPVPEEKGGAGEGNVRARTLLEALQTRRGVSLDREIAQALVDFLQSEELMSHISSATAEAVRDTILDMLTGQMSRMYLTTLERCHRSLVRHVTNVLEDAFVLLKEHTVSYWSSLLQRNSAMLRRTLHRHQILLRSQELQTTHVVQRVLEKELQQWRQRALDTVLSREDDDGELMEPADEAPASPPQPADSAISTIDQLMMTAEIHKLIQDGDVNRAFEKALSASDLSLVMAACRAIPPRRVFAPQCRVTSAVLLSLLQQLATDMVHDTQLKCRYLEEALICLNMSASLSRAHLSLVVSDMRKNLTEFLAKYPSHMVSRRVLLIIMAANNLLK